jgi:hypothetical protein
MRELMFVSFEGQGLLQIDAVALDRSSKASALAIGDAPRPPASFVTGGDAEAQLDLLDAATAPDALVSQHRRGKEAISRIDQMTFVHLRTHTEYSVVDGTLRIDAAVAAAARCRPAGSHLAITDLGNLFATDQVLRRGSLGGHQTA